jgi:hypothetical protein
MASLSCGTCGRWWLPAGQATATIPPRRPVVAAAVQAALTGGSMGWTAAAGLVISADTATSTAVSTMDLAAAAAAAAAAARHLRQNHSYHASPTVPDDLTALSQTSMTAKGLVRTSDPRTDAARLLRTLRIRPEELEHWVLRTRRWLVVRIFGPLARRAQAHEREHEAIAQRVLAQQKQQQQQQQQQQSQPASQLQQKAAPTALGGGGLFGGGGAGQQKSLFGGSTFAAAGSAAAAAGPYGAADAALREDLLRLSVERAVLDRYMTMSAYPAHAQYSRQRIIQLASGGALGGFIWDGGVEFEGRPWTPERPTDAHIVFHVFATYMDFTVPSSSMGGSAGSGPLHFSKFHTHQQGAPGDPSLSPLRFELVTVNPPHWRVYPGVFQDGTTSGDPRHGGGGAGPAVPRAGTVGAGSGAAGGHIAGNSSFGDGRGGSSNSRLHQQLHPPPSPAPSPRSRRSPSPSPGPGTSGAPVSSQTGAASASASAAATSSSSSSSSSPRELVWEVSPGRSNLFASIALFVYAVVSEHAGIFRSVPFAERSVGLAAIVAEDEAKSN